MKHSEEELQHKIERGEITADSPDALAYQRLFEVLKVEPYNPEPRFADDVIKRVIHRKRISPDHLWLLMGVLFFVVAAGIAVALTDFRPHLTALNRFSIHLAWLITAACLLILIQVLDRNLVHKRIRTA